MSDDDGGKDYFTLRDGERTVDYEAKCSRCGGKRKENEDWREEWDKVESRFAVRWVCLFIGISAWWVIWGDDIGISYLWFLVPFVAITCFVQRRNEAEREKRGLEESRKFWERVGI